MGRTDITRSSQARAVKPNSCMCKTHFAQKVINLFTDATTENSHPASLEITPNPLACSECLDLQNCSLSSGFPQLPTNKMLPKSPPPLQSHFSDCVCGSCHDGPEATFNTQLRYSEPGPRLGHRQDVSCRPSPTVRFAPGQAVAHHAHMAPEEGSQSSWAWGAFLVHPGLSAAEGEQTAGPASWSLVCKLPSKGKCLGRHSSNNTFWTTHGMNTSCLYCTKLQKSQVSHIPIALSPSDQHSP